MTDKPFICRTKDLAHILGVSDAEVHYYVKQGMPKHAYGKYSIPDTVQWCLERFKQKVGGPDLEKARQELYETQTQKHQLEIAERRHQLVEYDEAAGVLYEVSQIIIASMDGLAPRLGGVLADMDNPAKIEHIIEDEIRACREQASKRISKFAARHGNGSSDHPPTPRPKRRGMGKLKPNSSPRQPRAGTVA